jgi:hypothetical protein
MMSANVLPFPKKKARQMANVKNKEQGGYNSLIDNGLHRQRADRQSIVITGTGTGKRALRRLTPPTQPTLILSPTQATNKCIAAMLDIFCY